MPSQPSPAERYAAFRPAWKAFSVYLFGVAVFLVGPMVNPEAWVGPALGQLLATCFAGFVIVKRFTSLYQVDGQRISAVSTLFKGSTKTLAIKNIRRVDVRRGITQRMLDVAHVWIYEEGRDEPAIKLFGVPQPGEFKALLRSRGAGDEVVTGAWRQ